MEVFVNGLAGLAVEIVTIVVLSLLSFASGKLIAYLEKKKKKDELGIIDAITDQAVEFAESEFSGLKGLEKRDKAIGFALKVLGQKGIKIDRDEVIAGIENGVRKFNQAK